METRTLTLTADRPTLEYTIGGETIRWSYDVLPIKLECERLEKLYGVKDVSAITLPMAKDLQSYLIAEGFTHCTVDLALKMYVLIQVQFAKLFRAFDSKLETL